MTETTAPRIIGAYQLEGRIGQGGMGEVYLARHIRLNTERAIKLLPPALAGDPNFLKRFEREAGAAARLQHPNVLPLHEYGEADGAPYLVMPYIRGGTLKERLARGPLTVAALLDLLGQAAAALDYAHAQGLVHRDVKPANFLLDERGHLYLADFGIAKALDGSEGLTRTGVGVGTPEYMAPEQAQGRADARSDLYALGVILYQALTGRVPYSGGSTVEVLMKHQQDPLPLLPLRSATPPVSARVEAVLAKALAKNPNERYASGAALVEALREAFAAPDAGTAAATVLGQGVWAEPTAIGGYTPPPVGGYTPPIVRDGPSPRRRSRVIWGLVASVVALVVLCTASVVALAAIGARAAPTVQASATTTTAAVAATGPTGTTVGATAVPSGAPSASPSPSPSATIVPFFPSTNPVASPALTATTRPTTPPSAAPAASARPSTSSSAAPTAGPAPKPNGTVPPGWKVYTGRQLPFVMAYPPDWQVDESQVAGGVVSFNSLDRNTELLVRLLSTQPTTQTTDEIRDVYAKRLIANCIKSGVEYTVSERLSGILFAELGETCDLPNRPLQLFFIGVGLNNRVPWLFSTIGAYGSFNPNICKCQTSDVDRYFAPMLSTLNIYGNP